MMYHLVVCSMGGDGILLQPLQQHGREVAVALQSVLKLLGGEQQTDRVVLPQSSTPFRPGSYSSMLNTVAEEKYKVEFYLLENCATSILHPPPTAFAGHAMV